MEVRVPLNVSGVWYPVYDVDVSRSGSIGLSITLEPSVIVRGKASSEPRVYLVRGDKRELVVFDNLKVLRRLGSLEVEVYSVVPLGYGYGLSGAISLGYAVLAYELGLAGYREALLTAHESEVVSGNGLGDVISEYYGGGIVYRKRPGAPTVGEVEVFGVVTDEPICSMPERRLPTSTLLRVNENALAYISQFLASPSITTFFTVARRFTEELGFYSPYVNSFRKKGLILRLGGCGEGWVRHEVARGGVSVH